MLNLFKKHCHYLYITLVLITSAAVYTPQYGLPNALFWDENYHIASAQKYIDGIMYMEPHPPLGKLLIAGSEKILGFNAHLDKSAFSRTDYVRDPDMPEGLSYYGFRLPSTLLMTLSVLFFFGIVRLITNNLHVAAAFSFLMIFDNALVIQARSAMLEGIQLFFILAAIYYTVRVITQKHLGKPIHLLHYAWLGVLVGLATSVKINGLILLLLFVMLFGTDKWAEIKALDVLSLSKRLLTTIPISVASLVFILLATFYIHIALGTAMPTHQTYSASDEYTALINNNETLGLSGFVTALKDNYAYMENYANGVPRYDACKVGENGSLALAWPVGSKTISYRWSKDTIDGETRVRYHTIVANPVVWFSVAFGLVLSLGLIISRFVYGNAVKDTTLFYWICALMVMYLSYMLTMLRIERVMYLYHYLVPLLFGMLNLALLFTYIFRENLQQKNLHTYVNLAGFVILVIGVFFIFAPFTYSWELTEAQFELRNWFSFWKMQVVR